MVKKSNDDAREADDELRKIHNLGGGKQAGIEDSFEKAVVDLRDQFKRAKDPKQYPYGSFCSIMGSEFELAKAITANVAVTAPGEGNPYAEAVNPIRLATFPEEGQELKGTSIGLATFPDEERKKLQATRIRETYVDSEKGKPITRRKFYDALTAGAKELAEKPIQIGDARKLSCSTTPFRQGARQPSLEGMTAMKHLITSITERKVGGPPEELQDAITEASKEIAARPHLKAVTVAEGGGNLFSFCKPDASGNITPPEGFTPQPGQACRLKFVTSASPNSTFVDLTGVSRKPEEREIAFMPNTHFVLGNPSINKHSDKDAFPVEFPVTALGPAGYRAYLCGMPAEELTFHAVRRPQLEI